MKVQIIAGSGWYSSRTGQVFNVVDTGKPAGHYTAIRLPNSLLKEYGYSLKDKNGSCDFFIAKKDCVLVGEEKNNQDLPTVSSLDNKPEIEFIQKNKLGFCEGNIVLLACRWKKENGLEDLHKIKQYADLLIDSMKNI